MSTVPRADGTIEAAVMGNFFAAATPHSKASAKQTEQTFSMKTSTPIIARNALI
jgi:hypothetical protein